MDFVPNEISQFSPVLVVKQFFIRITHAGFTLVNYFSISPAHATARVATASVVGADDVPVDTILPLEEDEDVWITSQGKFKFKLEDQPPQLQVIYALLEVCVIFLLPICFLVKRCL